MLIFRSFFQRSSQIKLTAIDGLDCGFFVNAYKCTIPSIFRMIAHRLSFIRPLLRVIYTSTGLILKSSELSVPLRQQALFGMAKACFSDAFGIP